MAGAKIQGLTAPGFKFEPDDEEVIKLYLVPKLRGRPLPLDDVIIDDDPRSAPPWELFSRNGRGTANSAYFFASGDKGRKVAGGVGTWVSQRVERTGKLRVGEEVFEWHKHRLNFHLGSGRSGSIGWVMHEYSVVARAPDDGCAAFKVCHITFTGYGQKQKRKRVPDGYVDDHGAAVVTTMQPRFIDRERLPLVDPRGFYLPAVDVDHGMMPEQFAECGTMLPPKDGQDSGVPPGQPLDDNDPLLRLALESLGDFATAAQTDPAFGEHWASAGHHVFAGA